MFKRFLIIVIFCFTVSICCSDEFRYLSGTIDFNSISKKISSLSEDERMICNLYLSLYPEYNNDLTETYFIKTAQKLYKLSENNRLLWNVFCFDPAFLPSFIRDIYYKTNAFSMRERINILKGLMKKYKELDNFDSLKIIGELMIKEYGYLYAIKYTESFYKVRKFKTDPFYHLLVATYYFEYHKQIFNAARKRQKIFFNQIWDGSTKVKCEMQNYKHGVEIIENIIKKYPEVKIQCQGILNSYETVGNIKLHFPNGNSKTFRIFPVGLSESTRQQ